MSDTENLTGIVTEEQLETSKEETKVEGTKVEEKKEEIEEVEKPTEEQEKQGLFDKIKSAFYGVKKEQTKEEKGISDTSESKELEEDIDDDFTKAAISSGWTEQDVVTFAGKYTNEELHNLIPFIVTEEKKAEEDKEEVKSKAKEETKLDENLESLVDKVTKALDAKYQEKFAEVERSLKAHEQDRFIKEQQNFQNTADMFFDKAAKDFPVFGKTEELLRFPDGTPQAGQLVPAGTAFEARSAVWKTAVAFNKMGMPWNSALSESLDWYKGKFMEKDIHNKVVKELKGQQKRLSPKRAEHITEKKYENEIEERADVVLEAARKAGVKV